MLGLGVLHGVLNDRSQEIKILLAFRFREDNNGLRHVSDKEQHTHFDRTMCWGITTYPTRVEGLGFRARGKLVAQVVNSCEQ